VDGFSRRDASLLKGKTRTNKTVLFSGPPSLEGQLATIKIERADSWTLHGLLPGRRIHLRAPAVPAN
jgi:tRNA-2-methylthio-N6-dimethylallyladenosine synthase